MVFNLEEKILERRGEGGHSDILFVRGVSCEQAVN